MMPRIVYLEGRPHSHISHQRFAKAIESEFDFIDTWVRWQDLNNSKAGNLFAWIANAIFLSIKHRKAKIFLVDNLHFTPVLIKYFFMKRKKIIVHLGSHTLYFIYSHRFSGISETFHRWILRQYDILICEGKMAATLVERILGNDAPPHFTIFNGIPIEHSSYNSKPNLTNKRIIFFGNGPGPERLWYKGLDLMVEAFDLAHSRDPDLEFTVVGNWDSSIIDHLRNSCSPSTVKALFFEPFTNELGKFINESSLYLHCSRGEAFGITILIAMQNGLTPIISEWTGAKEIVEKVDSQLVSPLDANQIADKIIWYYSLSMDEKQVLSRNCVSVANAYSEKNAIKNYEEIFQRILNKLYH